jgi:hypothetical protein
MLQDSLCYATLAATPTVGDAGVYVCVVCASSICICVYESVLCAVGLILSQLSMRLLRHLLRLQCTHRRSDRPRICCSRKTPTYCRVCLLPLQVLVCVLLVAVVRLLGLCFDRKEKVKFVVDVSPGPVAVFAAHAFCPCAAKNCARACNC